MKIICEDCETEMRCVCDKCDPPTLTSNMTGEQHEQLHNICGEDLLSLMIRFGLCGASTEFLSAIAERTEQAYKLGFINGRKRTSSELRNRTTQ